LVGCQWGKVGGIDSSALWKSNSISETCRKLIDEANQRGGEDNITVIVARFDGDALPADPPR
jgi:serine/threonine protein phosphatase PrpC